MQFEGGDGVQLPQFCPTLSLSSLRVNLFYQDLGEMARSSAGICLGTVGDTGGRHRCPSGALEVRLHESFVSLFVVGFSGVWIPGRTFSVLCVYCCVLGIVTDQFFVIPFINFCTR